MPLSDLSTSPEKPAFYFVPPSHPRARPRTTSANQESQLLQPSDASIVLLTRYTVRSLPWCPRKQSRAQLNDSFTIPVNIPKPLLPCEVHVGPHKTLSHTPNINSTANNTALIADRVSQETYRDLESSAIAPDASDRWISTIGTCPSYPMRLRVTHPMNTKCRHTDLWLSVFI